MAVVTISREFGTEGGRIATEAAQALGYHVADKDVVERILRQYGLLHFEEVEGAVRSFWIYFDEQLRLTAEMLEQTIRALAQHGDVFIIGRGSYAVLHGLADVLNVRIQAPRAMRVQRVMAQYQLNLAEAETRVTQVDRERVTFIERVHHVRGEDARAFDLVINLGNIAPDFATRLIIDAARAMNERPRGDAPRAADFDVSNTLADAVGDVLGCETRHG